MSRDEYKIRSTGRERSNLSGKAPPGHVSEGPIPSSVPGVAPSFDALRAFTRARLHEVWQAAKAGEELEGEDGRMARVLLEHREFHPVWDRIPLIGEREFTVGGSSPFAHVAFHAAIEDQLDLGDPPELAEALEELMAAGMERHEACHLVANVLTAAVFPVLHGHEDFDASTYRARLKLMARLAREGTRSPIWRARPGRNDPCPCGSGRKSKRCCGADGSWPPDYLAVAANAGSRNESLGTRLVSRGDASQHHALMILGIGGYLATREIAGLPQDHHAIILQNTVCVADAFEEKGDWAGALAAYRQNVELAASLEETWLQENALQDLLFFSENHPGYEEQAIDVARRLAELTNEPRNKAAYRVDLADLHARRGEMAEAEAAYRGVIADFPDYPWALLNWARFLRDSGRLEEAEGAYRSVLTVKSMDDDVAEVKEIAREELEEITPQSLGPDSRHE